MEAYKEFQFPKNKCPKFFNSLVVGAQHTIIGTCKYASRFSGEMDNASVPQFNMQSILGTFAAASQKVKHNEPSGINR